MVGKEKRTKSYILTVVGVIIALYVHSKEVEL